MAASSKVIGGLNPTPERDKDKLEQNEPRREREPDLLDGILEAHLHVNPGMHIVNKQFYGPYEGLRSAFDITFYRHYPSIDLLVQNFSRRRLYEDLNDEAFNADLKKYSEFAESVGMQFLPVIDGVVEVEDLGRISIPARGAQVPLNKSGVKSTQLEELV
jgi:hypothetical protein